MFRFFSRSRSARRPRTSRPRSRRLGFEVMESRQLLSATYYVSPNGSDTITLPNGTVTNNPGTSLQAPLQTLQAAYNLLQPNQGATIEMLGGLYHPNAGGFGGGNISGAPGQPIIIEPYNNQVVQWDFSETYGMGTSPNTWQPDNYGGWEVTLPADSYVATYNDVRAIGADGLFATATGGSIAAIDPVPVAGGSGYQVGDVLKVIDTTSQGGGATVTVTAVNAGAVTQVALASAGQDGYLAGNSIGGWPWRTAPLTGSGSGCTLQIAAVTPLTYMNPSNVAGLANKDLTWYDVPNRTLHFKPADGVFDPSTVHIVSSSSQLDFTTSYFTIQGIDVQNAEFGIHIDSANAVVLNGDRFQSVNQGILIGGQNSTIENCYVDKVGGASLWYVDHNAYRTSALNQDLYIEGSGYTIENNFFGRSFSGYGIQALGVNNSVWDGNITYDDSAGGFLLVGNNNLITNHIDVSPATNPGTFGFIFWFGANTGNVIENSYFEAAIPLDAGDVDGFSSVGGFTLQNDTFNTIPGNTAPGRFSLDVWGPQLRLSDTFMDANTWIGQQQWDIPGQSFTNHQDFVNWLSQTVGVNWEQTSTAVTLTGTFEYNTLNAAMDSSMPTWTGAADSIRAYAAAEVAATKVATAGGANAINHAYEFQAGTPLSLPASQGLLTGATDSQGYSLTASLVSVPANGQVTVNSDGSFTYAPAAGFSGADSFIYEIHDPNGNNAVATVTIFDPPSPLTGSSAAVAGGTEGQSNSSVLSGATFTDTNPGNNSADMTATITWADGGPTSPGIVSYDAASGVYMVAGSHTYAEAGSYNISIAVVDANAATTATISGTATVADAALTVTATPVTTAVYGEPFSGEVATLTDANPLAPLSDIPLANVTIQWGDGSTSDATAITQPGGIGTPFDVFGSHTYDKAGATANPLLVTITDVGGRCRTPPTTHRPSVPTLLAIRSRATARPTATRPTWPATCRRRLPPA